jgi:hypothetical protein
MINEVRNTVLAILSKDNNGYLTPDQFNLYADIAQKERYEQYTYDYSNAINKRNAHLFTSGLGDVPQIISEVIDRFRTTQALTYDGASFGFEVPTDAYSLGVVTTTAGEVIEKIAQDKINRLLLSLDTSPTEDFPVYTIVNNPVWTVPTQLKVYPSTIVDANISYLRYPKTPKWTYIGLSGGEPVFNLGAADYQDFELPESDKMFLIVKILQYAGTQISDEEVVRAAKTDEIQEKQEHR